MLLHNLIKTCLSFAQRKCPFQREIEEIYLIQQLIDHEEVLEYQKFCLNCSKNSASTGWRKNRRNNMSSQDRRCDKCKSTGKYIYKICSDCSLTICIYCLSDLTWIVKEPPPECPECSSENFLTVDQSPPLLIS